MFVAVRNFGPFEHVEVELKPLTIIVGKNNVGKSTLAYLIWALAATTPNFRRNRELEAATADDVEDVVEMVKSGADAHERLVKIVKRYIDALPKALAVALEEALRKIYLADLFDLIRRGTDKAYISVKGANSAAEVVVTEKRVEVFHAPYAQFLEGLRFETLKPGVLRVPCEEKIQPVSTAYDVAKVIACIIAAYIRAAFGPLLFSASAAAFPDGRAGLSRALLRLSLPVTMSKEVSRVDEQYAGLFYRLAEYAYRGRVDMRLVEPLLAELGASLELVQEGGLYTVHIRTWTGKRLRLQQAPSGLRESIVAALALASEADPLLVVLEEPEARLHPGAQLALLRIIATAAKRGKYVLITTHSEETARILAKDVGMEKTAIYHAHPQKDKAVLTPLNTI
ncbi:AAA family ATPase [Pyrobaculum calidifontis]|uniref:ATPase AAA-type core domain-containing protein n=1 Tax=Pyrobaculum calidifontis (strain DSM 21063 / JCM 11548 / VA1) TaxID=410359 RepID=A3MU98_PYRCJ|nr:AAA family ATPase [Pyrobaculum calidifontis]ABO08215.1 conserved hypothetical protein [Pyrobaculum calidifontis JCM 11548]